MGGGVGNGMMFPRPQQKRHVAWVPSGGTPLEIGPTAYPSWVIKNKSPSVRMPSDNYMA